MKRAIFLTAYNRLNYLQETLDSWSRVRGLKDWHFVASIEPSSFQDQVVEEFTEFARKVGLDSIEIRINPERYGVLSHPWQGFQDLLDRRNFDFAVRAEDDLVVSDDILEYFTWASETYRNDPRVATVNAFSLVDSTDTHAVVHDDGFSAWLWGTWADRWNTYLVSTWDHDYSTFNGSPGNQSGWDWNLDTRVFPTFDVHSVRPEVSRVDNIGVYGVHGTEENFIQAASFSRHHEPGIFFERQ